MNAIKLTILSLLLNTSCALAAGAMSQIEMRDNLDQVVNVELEKDAHLNVGSIYNASSMEQVSIEGNRHIIENVTIGEGAEVNIGTIINDSDF